MKILESAEDYLEAILVLQRRTGSVRSIDIASELGYSKPSVSVAMKRLRESGHIVMDANGIITLTDAGQQVATRIYERHTLLTSALIDLGVNEQTARQDACRLEHDLSAESFACIKKFYLDVCKKKIAEA